MEKIKIGFLIISFRKNIEIYVDENTGMKYLMTGHDYYEGDCYCSGLTPMYDENGKPDRYSKEQVAYLKSIALDISRDENRGTYQSTRRKRKTANVAYDCIEI